MKSYIPEGYVPKLNLYDTQKAISLIKDVFQESFSKKLNLKRVSAPLFVECGSGLNDDLNGYERSVKFDIPAAETNAEIIHSLAKWKRMALYKYDFRVGNGLYTDMNAIRRDEETDNLHSIYVDQWDWEKVISAEDRNIDFLKCTVKLIAEAIYDTQCKICEKFPELTPMFSKEVKFITSQELENLYPSLTPAERENEYVKIHKTIFIMQIGEKLKSGIPHDGRAPDYDDWKLNGDLICYNPILDSAIEFTSMGIRVDPESLREQLKKTGHEDKATLLFHSMLLEGKLPLTIGGGIGQSRICMLLLNKAHIGEVQSSLWDKDTIEVCEAANVALL